MIFISGMSGNYGCKQQIEFNQLIVNTDNIEGIRLIHRVEYNPPRTVNGHSQD